MRPFLICIVLCVFHSTAEAHHQAPPGLGTVAASDTVYLVHVQSVDESSKFGVPLITFSVAEVLRGPAASRLVLNAELELDFKPNTNWIIYRIPWGSKDWIGWALEGDREWIPLSTDPANHNWLSGYHFSVDQVREYLRTHPAKT
jgi:hypothetical protein